MPIFSLANSIPGAAALGMTIGRPQVISGLSINLPPVAAVAAQALIGAGDGNGVTELNHALSASVFPSVSVSEFANTPGNINDLAAPAQTAFGGTIDQYGLTAIIGAAAENPGNVSGTEGVAYIYTQSSTGWTRQATLQGSDTAAGDFFGASTTIYGSTIAVANNPGTGTAKVYVFTGAGAGWTQTQELVFTGATNGVAVKLWGSFLFIAVLNAANTGTVYIYQQASVGVYNLLQTLTQAGVGNFFGGSNGGLDYDGQTLAIGAIGSGTGGEVFLYEFVAGSFQQYATLVGSDTVGGDQFGVSVALTQNLLAVGANRANTQGRAYVFLFEGNAWTQVQEINSPNAAGFLANAFGNAVGVLILSIGTYLMIGAPFFDSTNTASGGCIYFYFAPAGTGADPTVTLNLKGMKVYNA
jgi:hypothetical protein